MRGIDWHDLLPHGWAIRQKGWERARIAVRLRDAGLTYREIGRHMGVSLERARQMDTKGRRTPPVELYCAQGGPLAEVASAVQKAQKRASIRMWSGT